VGALADAGGFSLQSSKNLPGGEGGIFVTNDEKLADVARSLRTFGQDVAAGDAEHYDPRSPLDGHRALASVRVGSMYRGNEMMAAFVRAQLARLPALTQRCQENAERLRRGLAELPGVHMPRVPDDRRSVHHKVRVHLDPGRAGLSCSAQELRDAMLEALAAEGLAVVLWQADPLPAQPIFRGVGFGKGFPWSSADAARARQNYEADFRGTRRLLDGSIVLFSQSCPLIAQDAAMVDRYVEAFAKVWAQRDRVLSWWSRSRR
jgi:dTDP-4-amino-4,6-dideoxygalactose transaminase